jgi:hypothetical protein
MFCTQCGKEVRTGSRFCPYCGEALPTVPPSFGAPTVESSTGLPDPSERQRSPWRGLWWVIVALIVVVLAGGGTGGYLIVHGHHSSAPTVESELLAWLATQGYDPVAVQVTDVATYGDWVVATIHDTAKSGEDALVVLKKDGDHWVIVDGPGTWFAGDDIPGAPAELLAAIGATPPDASSTTIPASTATTVTASTAAPTSTAVSTFLDRYLDASQNLATILQNDDERMPDLATEINNTVPQVPQTVYDELETMSKATGAALAALKALTPPAAYKEADSILRVAAAAMITRIDETAGGIRAMWTSESVTAGTPYFDRGRQARDDYRLLMQRYRAALPGGN